MQTTVIVDFDTCLAWVLEEPEYRFNFNATHDAVALLNAKMGETAGKDSLAFRVLLHAHDRLQRECSQYLIGK